MSSAACDAMKPNTLVPFDFSDSAREALAWAADLHSTLKSAAPIHLVHFISTSPSRDPMSIMQVLLPTEEETATLKNSLQEAAGGLGARAEVDVIVSPLPIGEAIVARAEEAHMDLIVMGTHGWSGVRRMVLGSVADHVVRHSPCPVVTLRARQSSEAR